MASAIKETFSKPVEGVKKSVETATAAATGGDDVDSDQDPAELMADKYMLRITAGPSYDQSTQKPVFVNTDTPTLVENDFVTAKIKVRIRGYDGLPRGSQNHSAYFDDERHIKDQYSVGFSFVPKKDFTADGAVWGNDFAHPVRDRLPPSALVSMAWKIFKQFIDPGVDMDAYADEPWLYGPVLSTWFQLRIGEKLPPDQHSQHEHDSESNPVREGADGEEAAAIRQKFSMPDNNEKRRKHFLNKKNMEGFMFEKDRLYQGDFHNPYIDFGRFSLKLPGFSISAIKYINDKSHNLRYVFKNVKTGDVYFVIYFSLLFGADVDKALEEEEKRIAAEKGTGGNVKKQDAQVEEFVDAPEQPVGIS